MYLLWGKGGLLWFTGVVGVEHWSFLIILLLLVKRQSFSCAFNLLFHILLYFVCYHVFSCVDQQKGTSYEINSTSIFILHCLSLNQHKFSDLICKKTAFSLYSNMAKIFLFCVHKLHLAYMRPWTVAFSFFTPLTFVKRDRFQWNLWVSRMSYCR